MNRSLFLSLIILSIGIFMFFDMYGQIQGNLKTIIEKYPKYKEKSLAKRHLRHEEVISLIENIDSEIIDKSVIGKSMSGKDIYLLKLGEGETDVLFWSQMHGDESTATMAIFDLMNFFQHNNSSIRKKILKETTLHFIPMLNPDGADLFQRHAYLGIDINRDAVRLTTPEARVLKAYHDAIKPQFGFNLHDQDREYSAGSTGNTATISLLAPAFNEEKTINDTRKKAMQLIVAMKEALQPHIPGSIARYDDTYEPRSFGDNMQKWGTSSILLESGWNKDDWNKQFVRKLNFIALLAGLNAIATRAYQNKDIEDYKQIPFNEKRMIDLILRNGTYYYSDNAHKIDIGINYEEVFTKGQMYYRGKIEEIGDLSTKYGYHEIDLKGWEISPGRVYPEKIKNTIELRQRDLINIVKQGYTYVQLEETDNLKDFVSLPINVIEEDLAEFRLHDNALPNFIIENDNGSIEYVLLNGFIYNNNEGIHNIYNGVVVDTKE